MSEGLPPGRATRRLVLGVVTIGTFMAVLDISIVNVALPQIMTSFGVNVPQVKWVSTSFLLTTAVCVPMTGWLGRRFGLRRLFISELLIFTFGLGLCTIAWSLKMLVVARIIEALGAGAIMPTSLAILTQTFPPAERGRAIGIWGIGFMLGPALGPTTGGYLMEWFDWRAIFAINLPVGVVAIVLSILVLRPGRREIALPFDWKGYLALVTFLVVGLVTLDQGQDLGWDSQIILMGMGVTGAAFLLFVALVWDAEYPVFPLRLLRSPDFSASVVLGLIRPIPLYGALFMLPLFLQNVQGRDTIDTGLLLVPAAVMTGLCMPLAGMLTDRFGPRWPTVIGVVATTYSLYLFTALDPLTGVWAIVYPQFWRGIGVSLLMTAVNTAAINSVPSSESGTASWVLNLTLSVGGAFTIGVLGTMLHRNTLMQMDLLGAAPALAGPPPRELVNQALKLGYSTLDSGPVAFAALLRQVSRTASTLAFQNLYTVLTLLTLAGLLPALLLSSGGSRRSAAGNKPGSKPPPPPPPPPPDPVPDPVPEPAMPAPSDAPNWSWSGENRVEPDQPAQRADRRSTGATVQWKSGFNIPSGRWERPLILGVVMLGPFLALLEGSVVNVALPSIMTTFGVNINQAKWVATAFMLSTAVGMPLTGWLGRRIGLGRTYLLEMAIFISGSALSALSWNLDVLVFGRVIGAIGAGSLMPTSLAIVTSIFPPSQRGRAIGIWGIGFMLAPAFGPTLGGFLTEWIEWRAIFGVNIPLGLLSLLLAGIVLERGEADHSIPFDWKGYLSLGTFLVAGLLTLDQGHEQGWNDPLILSGVALSLGAFLFFLVLAWDEEHPILPLRLFRNLDFSLAVWLGMVRAVGLFGTLFLLPVFLQNVQGLTPIDTGIMMMPAPLVVAASMPIAGVLTDRFGPRWLTFMGILLVSYSLYLYAALDPLSSKWDLVYPQLWRGVGMALVNTPVSTTAMNAVRRKDAGNASWVITLTRMMTASATIALMGTLLPSWRREEMDRLGAATALQQMPPTALMRRAREMGFSAGESGRVVRDALLRRVSHMANALAFQRIHMRLAVFVLTGLVPAYFMTGKRKEEG